MEPTAGLVGEVRDFLAELRRDLPDLYPPEPAGLGESFRAPPADREAARAKIEERLAFWAPRLAVDYGRVSVRDQKTRWASCSSKGDLSFNWRLVFAPQAVMDYVVIHELAHRREMNHSRRFWAIVAEHSPDHREHRRWLHENYRALRRRREAAAS
ncbi:MAG: M48 family metallopeptidase [Elusimicrobia bacterium]|nr:M48 family metallopeptidase [Elusimicrobiota bacterium]